jgi:hypothetical protein
MQPNAESDFIGCSRRPYPELRTPSTMVMATLSASCGVVNKRDSTIEDQRKNVRLEAGGDFFQTRVSTSSVSNGELDGQV